MFWTREQYQVLEFEDIGVMLKTGTPEEKEVALQRLKPLLIHHIITKWKTLLASNIWNVEDFLQELYIIALNASRTWKPSRGSFYTYLLVSINNRMKRLSRKINKDMRLKELSENLKVFVGETSREFFPSQFS